MKDTLEAAQSDAEHQVAEKLKRKAQYAACMLLVQADAVDGRSNDSSASNAARKHSGSLG